MIELLLIGVVLLVAMSKQFNGGGQFGNSMSVLRFRLATSYIEFKTAIGVGLGGVKRVDRTGITTVTDGGVGGLVALRYDPTNDRVGIGTATPTARVEIHDFVSSILLTGPSGVAINAPVGTNPVGFRVFTSGTTDSLHVTDVGVLSRNWLLAKGVCGDDRSDFINVDWAAAAAPGVKWRIQTVTAPAAVAGRGGIERFGTANVTPCVLDGLTNAYSAQDGWRMTARFAIQSTADDAYLVGVSDAPAAVAPNSMPYVNDGAFIVHISGLGANFFHRTIVGAGAVSVDTGVAAVAGEYVRVDQIALTTRAIQLYINGTLVTTSVVAQSPLAATLLRKAFSANNSGGAVAAFIDMDVYDIVESRNTAVTA